MRGLFGTGDPARWAFMLRHHALAPMSSSERLAGRSRRLSTKVDVLIEEGLIEPWDEGSADSDGILLGQPGDSAVPSPNHLVFPARSTRRALNPYVNNEI